MHACDETAAPSRNGRRRRQRPPLRRSVVLNDRLDSAPVLQSSLSSSGQISGGFTEEKARALSAILKAGALRQKPELIAERTVAPDLAGSARNIGVLSIAVGFAAVLLLMAWLYLGPGAFAGAVADRPIECLEEIVIDRPFSQFGGPCPQGIAGEGLRDTGC